MMWASVLNRREVLDILSPGKGTRGGIDARKVDDLPRSTKPEDVVAVWPTDPANGHLLPAMFVINDGDSREFLAWVSTYVRELLPFTSFCRVVERTVVKPYFPG